VFLHVIVSIFVLLVLVTVISVLRIQFM